jgi:hypothetical protein
MPSASPTVSTASPAASSSLSAGSREGTVRRCAAPSGLSATESVQPMSETSPNNASRHAARGLGNASPARAPPRCRFCSVLITGADPEPYCDDGCKAAHEHRARAARVAA